MPSIKQDISVIGIVFNKRITKNKNILLELEDFSGKIKVIISSYKEDVFKKAKTILPDEVIAIKGNGNNEIIFGSDIVFPEVSETTKNLLKEESYAVFTSDIHIGSKKFIEDKFNNFIEWLNGNIGNEEQKEISKKIKYLFIAGDSVDGVGVFPGQSDLLNIKDIKEQYIELAKYLKKIRKDITIFLIPGQHDASRIAEPQPPISKEYAAPLYEIENLFLLSNPAMVEIGLKNNARGIKVLMYHGASYHPIIEEIEELKLTKAQKKPTKVSKYLLQKRHLAPSHSDSDKFPVAEVDPLIIKQTPDIFVNGDLHRSDVDFCGPITLISSSCWQYQTEFEEKVGNIPDPCKVPLLNLKTGKVNILDFS